MLWENIDIFHVQCSPYSSFMKVPNLSFMEMVFCVPEQDIFQTYSLSLFLKKDLFLNVFPFLFNLIAWFPIFICMTAYSIYKDKRKLDYFLSLGFQKTEISFILLLYLQIVRDPRAKCIWLGRLQHICRRQCSRRLFPDCGYVHCNNKPDSNFWKFACHLGKQIRREWEFP